jgi:hypothetical protein
LGCFFSLFKFGFMLGFIGRFGVGFYLLAVILKLYFIMQQIQDLGVVERIKAPTPRFFRVIWNVGIVLGAVGTTILTAGAVAAAVSQTTVDWKAYERQRFVGL